MESRQLRYVTHVARTRSVSQTARELFISRQAVSKALLSLERELGFEIFDREAGMEPTSEGANVLEHMERALAELEEIELYARSLRQGDQADSQRALTVAYKSFPLDYLFFCEGNPAFDLVEEFLRRSPGLRMTSFSMSDSSILDALETGALDVGVVQGSYARPGLAFLALGLSETRVIVPRDAPLCARAPLHVNDLEGVAIRSPLDLDQFTSQFIARCKAAGFEPSFQIVSLNDTAIGEFSAAGGVHIQPFDPHMEQAFPQLAFLPFHPDDRIDLPLNLVWRADTTDLDVRRLVNFSQSGTHRRPTTATAGAF